MYWLKFTLRKSDFLIGIILIISAILRFWNAFDIPFTHDEFSALFRTQFSSFSQLIEQGVMPDGHPAGIQVFLYIWVKIVGFSEFWIKLPFLLMGFASIWLIWKIAKEWFSENVALLAASTLAFMQYFIMYSQIARPYISGLFFTLLLVWYWSRFLFCSDRNKKVMLKNALGFILGAVLCSYNHYFSLLMVVLVSFIGFFYINRNNYRWYISSLLAIVVLFLPHVKIFFYQLSLQGLGWLGKPKPTFFIDFINYLTHFNFFVMLCFIIILCWALGLIIKKHEKISKEQFISLFLGVSSALIGYVYSIYRAPVLQYSVLIFSVPFFFLFVFSFFKNVKKAYINVLVVVWSLLLINSLVFSRNYYQNFYKSIYKETFKEIKSIQNDSTLVLCGFTREIGNYYIKELEIKDTNNIYYPYLVKNKKELYSLLENPKFKTILIATVTNDSPSLFALCHEYFPYMQSHKFLDQGEIRVLKRGQALFTGYTFLNANSFGEKNAWNFDEKNIRSDVRLGAFYSIDSLHEYDVQFEFQNKNEIKSYTQIADISAWIYLPEHFKGKAHLVASIEKDSTLLWQSTVIDDKELPKKKWIPISTSLFFPDFKYPLDSIKIKTYFWNPDHQTFYVSKTFFGIRNGNPKVYWIYFNIEEDLN